MATITTDDPTLVPPVDSATGAIDPAIREGQEAWRRLAVREQNTWNDWMAVGEALRIGRHRSMIEAGTNRPAGTRYKDIFGDWLRQTGFDAIDKGTRSYLLECLEHRSDVEAWREALPLDQRLKFNHPRIALHHWRKSIPPAADKPAKVSPVAQLKEAIVRLEHENQQLRDAGDDLFSAGNSATDIARLLADRLLQCLSPAKARQVIAHLPRVFTERAELSRESMKPPKGGRKHRSPEDFRRDIANRWG